MKFEIIGGKKCSGEIEVSGSKNNALKILAASLLFKNPVVIENVPQIEDIFRMNELLKDLGVNISFKNKNTFVLDSSKVKNFKLSPDIAKRLRASIAVAGPLLGRFNQVIFPYPGGCVIGKRPVDIFLGAWKKMGANVSEKNDVFSLKAKKIKEANIVFRLPSVTATEAVIMTAVLGYGKTIIWNPAREPEVLALIDFLNASGAKIFGAGTSKIEIIGTNGKLLESKKPFKIIPDRIEAGSFLILGAALADYLKIKNCNPEHLMNVIGILEDAGVQIKIGKNFLEVKKPKKLLACNIKTLEYPGFPTDLQAPFVVLMTQAYGQSMVFETIYDGRLNYIEDLNRMNAQITMCDPHRVIINGPTKLRGREIESPDLRAGLAFVLAALIARGKSLIYNIYQIDRGYEKIEEKLQKIGLNIKRIE
jgi:UDP-N-acetylglucosamine 1-carboxyvinyltransferase